MIKTNSSMTMGLGVICSLTNSAALWHRMSLQNKWLHEELGNPSVERFKSVVDPEDDANIADIECGFYNRAVGDVITRFVPGRTANEIMELRDDLVKHSRADVLELKRQAAQAARVSMDVE